MLTFSGQYHCSEKGPYFRDRVPIGTFFTFWVPLRTIFSVFSLNSGKECQFSQHTYSFRKTCVTDQWSVAIDMSVMSKFMHHCWGYWLEVRILCYTLGKLIFYAYALIIYVFGPYFGCQGSLLDPSFIKTWILISELSCPYKFLEQ